MLCNGDDVHRCGSSAELFDLATLPTRVPPDEWGEVFHRYANGESLRQLAVAFCVSHETIRQIVKRVKEGV
jgi:hypothetical protein